jgi:hypothetical protein
MLPPLSPAKIADIVSSEPVGTITGEVFGDGSPLYGLARNSCGDGTVLRPIFRRSAGRPLEVGPPIPLRFYGLATKRPVTYDEKAFRVTVDFDHDTAERLAGKLRITYREAGDEKVFVDLEHDGAPLPYVVPPKMTGDGNMATYSSCYPSGYYAITDSGGDVLHRGLVRIVELEGAAYTQVLFGDDTALQILMASRDPKKGIDPAQTVTLAEARRTTGDVGLLVDVSHRPQLTSPAEAIGANLSTMQKSKVVDGKATIRIYREAGKRWVDATFEDLQLSSIIEGPLSGQRFATLRIFGRMVDAEARPTELPAPPDFYKSGDDEPATP